MKSAFILDHYSDEDAAHFLLSLKHYICQTWQISALMLILQLQNDPHIPVEVKKQLMLINDVLLKRIKNKKQTDCLKIVAEVIEIGLNAYHRYIQDADFRQDKSNSHHTQSVDYFSLFIQHPDEIYAKIRLKH